MVKDFTLFLNSCKQPLDAFSDIIFAVCTMLLRIYKELE